MTTKLAKHLVRGDRIETYNVDRPAGKPVVVTSVEVHQGRARIYYEGAPRGASLTRWADETINLVEEQ